MYFPRVMQVTEIFTIMKVISREPPVYKIKDYEGKEINGIFYSEEFQRVRKVKKVIGKFRMY